MGKNNASTYQFVLLLGCAPHGRVVNEYTILTCTRSSAYCSSLTVLRPSQAFHDVICECRILFAIFPTVAYRTCMDRSR